jgi:hypothetical protein
MKVPPISTTVLVFSASARFNLAQPHYLRLTSFFGINGFQLERSEKTAARSTWLSSDCDRTRVFRDYFSTRLPTKRWRLT